MATNKNTDWRANVAAMMTDPNYAEKMASVVKNARKVNTDLMNKGEELESSLSLNRPTSKPLDLSRVQEMQTEQAARATMQGDDSGVADLAVQAYADARKQIGDEVSKQMADDKSMAFVHPMAAGILRSAESMKAGDVQKTFDRMLENNAVRQAIETKANKELTAALGKNPALTEEQQKDIYNKSVQRQIDAISGRVNQYLLDVNAPKSEGEYVLKSAVGNSLIGKSMLQAARNISGLESAEYDYGQQALADYDANKASWYAKGGAAIGGLLLDAPMMQGIGSASSATLGRGTSMALGKAASNTLWGKMLIGQATAAGTLGGYNFTSTLASQMMGGRFDAGELFGSTLHGIGLGAATGGMTPLLRGATAGMGAVGKTATMGGGILGEAAAFSAPEWAETFNENPYDFKAYAEALGTNVMVIAGLKASNLPKTVQEYKEWWNQGKTSGFTDADYKALSDYALAKGYANDGAFAYQDGVYQRSMADRATGGRNILTLTKLEGGGEKTLAMEMYQDPNVPLSMKTKIAAKMGLPAPNPVLPNAVEARDNVVNAYYEYREQMSDGTYVTRRILVDSKEMPSKRKARAAASEFGRTKARQNSIIQSEAEANTDATNAIVMARLTEQAWRSGTNVSDEVARMYDIAQRAQRGEASAEDIAYYQSIMEGTTEVTDRIKADIKGKTGVDIDEVLKQEGTFNTAQDNALTMYTEALASLKDNSKPTTERGTTASQASIADYIELKGMGIEQTKQLLNDPAAKVAAEKEIRNKYNLWLKYFDGQMTEEQLAPRLGYNLDNTKGLMDFVNEESFFRGKAANRIAYNAANAAKRLLEQGSGGVRFTEDGKVKLQGVPYSIAVDESIVDRYRAAQQGSGENYQRIANDALKDIIRQSEQPIEEMLQQMATDEQAIANEPQTEQEAVTQQMVDNRLAEIDTDLQGIEADGIQRVNINDKPAMIVKGRIATLGNGEIDRAKSSTEVAYIPLDENGRPIKNEQGKPVVEVGVKPSNVRISEVEPWRTIEDYKRAEEQRIRDNNRLTDEAIAQVGAEGGEVKEEMPTLDNAIVEPKDADELIAMCDGDKALALDVAVDELAKAQAAKGKGASTAETIDINRRIRTYQQIVDRLSASEMPDAAAADVESEQKGEATKAEPQVTDDMEFIYQGLDENHEGMEPMQMADGRYKWVGLQRGELTATMGERDVELLDGLAKKLGVAVIPINVKDRAVNGYYRDGNIYVNTNRGAEWTMRWVAGHEMLHDVAKKSPEAYDAYKQAVLDMWGSDYIDDQVKQIIDDYAASGKTIDREQALTELVNDFGGELFNSRDGLNILDNILKSESRKGNTGFVNTIKQWWERLKEWFGGTPYYKNVEKLLKDAYSEAIANAEEFRRNQEMDKGVSSVTDAARVEGAVIDFSIKTEPQVAQRLREYAESEDGKKHGWDKKKIESIIDETEDLIDAIHNSLQGNQRYDAWADKNPTMRVDWRDGELKQTVTWSRGNVEYKYDMSADLLCINNEALEDVLASPAMVQIVRGMDTLSKNGFTSDDYLRIYQVLRDKGFVVPCAGCFDAAARFKMLPSVAKNFADLVNKTIDERNADPEAFDAKVKAMAKGETTIEGLPTSANTKQDAIMIGVAGDKLTEHITSEQLLSAQGQTDMLATLGGIFRAWQRTGAGRPKDKLLPEPYVGDINSTSTTILGKYGEKTPSYRDIYVNQGTGLRRNSHSEFRPLLAIDEIQFMRDAFAKGLTVFKYMKELDDVRLFGNMGVKFNMSFFPAFVKDGVAAGLDANGNYIASEESVGSREFAYMGEDGRTHFDGMKGWQEAQKYTNENVSLSSVVFSVPHLIKSLTDVPTPSDKSGMWGSLIPFHSTGATSAHLALQGLGRARANGIGHPFSEAMHDYNKGVTNFEDVQNDRFGEGWVIVEGKKAGTAIKDGHKLEFANGTHMYNERLGVHLFKDGYIFDKDIKKKDNYGNGKVNTKNVKKYMTKFYVDYNDKVRELGGDYAYKDAADYYLRELPKIGLIPRFSFEVPESIYLEMCKAANVDPKHPKLGWKGEGNAWNPIDAESYYSLFCDYGMTDPKTGKWSPHKPIGNVDENGNRVFRLPDNAVQIVKDAVDKYSARRDKEESRINDVYEEFLKRSVKDGRLSEAEAQNLLSEISANADYSISRKIDEKYPNWLEGTTTSSGKHSTQVAGTIGTYRKVGKWIKENLGNDIRILDASSGMGLGTEALRKDGMQIDDVEPYQSEERKKTNPATFSSYKDINGKYDFIISNAVLNVIPDDWRSNVLHDMVARLNNGGRLFINTRKAGEEKTIKDKIELDSPQEILVKRNGKIASYQRFFTPNELKEWVENELGEGYSVEVANEKNSGTKGLAAVVVHKLGKQPTNPNGGGEPTEDTEFSVKADKELEKRSLVGIHNLTEDNLRYALNLGGLANPSTAVIDKNIMSLEGFGDISLIMPKSLVAKSTGKNAGTFAGDAYTPRFPKGDVVKYITKEGEKAIRADYPGDDKFSKDFREAWQSYGNEYGGITPALYYMYKLENGGAKIVKAEAPKIKSKEHQRMIDKFGNKEWYELNDAEKRELVDYRKSEMIESLKGADKNMVDKVVNDFINSADPEDLAYKKLRMLKMNYKEQQKAGEIDYMATYRNAQDDVALAGEQAKFNKWLADKSKRYGIEDRIFRGYTSSGNRKYAPMTLANISKVMKEQGRAGAETFMTKSAYSLRGKMLPVYKTLEQIKKNKNKLADTETYEKFRKEIGDEYNELILDISELPNVEYDDTHYILEDALLKGFDYAEKQAGVQISDAVRERISAFGNLLKEAPVKYFETKFERPVMFDEFVAAVVPKNINPELRKALADKGLAIEEYERGSEESRLEAVRRASDRDDVQFSVKGKRADESVLDYAKRMSEETGKKNLLNGGSYFSGGGLLEEGLKGIVNPTIAVEFNQKVAGVYRNNFGEHIVTADVRNVDPASLVKNIDGPVAYFHASPVCKNFSKAKQSAEELPLDKATAQSTAEFISKVRPKIVTIENVKGYRDSESMKIILDELKKQGYNYDVDVYNAADYGAYTSRERLIVRAVRDWSLPAKPMVMLADDRPSGWLEAVADIIDTLPEKKGGVAKWMDERLMAMGIDYRNIDKPLYVFGSGYSKDRIGYAFADELVPTLRTKGGDVIVMPDGRVLKATPRVLARISGMSDEYEMPKTDDLAHTIVGNGIPVQLTKAVMGSLIENVKSDLDAGNTEYSIIGKRGAANLDKRDETSIRVDNMVTAEEMEKAGKDAKTIRMATGWERGADGKWRYEVKDLVMLPAEQWIGKRNKKLSDIVENADELFAAYPELANVKIKEGNGKTYGGSYSSGVITLDTYLAKLWMKRLPDSLPRANKFMNETLIHEIQHYIQEKEGFAAGGNEGMILNKDATSEIDALISDSNKLAVQYNDMIAKGVYEGREEIKEKIISLRAEANAIKKKNVIGAGGYRSLAGEVEARNAEFRSNMTDKERANTMLADTEDVGRGEQIVYGNTDDVQFSIKGGKGGLKGVHSDAYKRIIELADAYTKEVAEHENDYEWKDSYNDYSKRVESLAKTLTDEALKELYNELEERQDGLNMWIIDILKGREAMSMRKRADEQAESNKRALSKVKVELDALKEAVKSGNKSTIKRTKEALTEAVIKHGLGHKYMREQIALLKQIKRTDANYARNKAAADAMESAVVSVEAELNNAIEKAGFEGVSLSFSNDYAFWLSAKQGSKFRETVEGLDNNERWFAEVDERTGGLPSDLPQLTMNNIDEYVARVKDTLAPGVTIENPKGSLERVDKMSKKEKAEYYQQGQIEQERAEYEAKEQWRRDNAGAITSSFFAERRADRAAEVARLKKRIDELKDDSKNAIAEDGAKVKDIASEMTSFIKQNISTEVQSDMTRNQFKGILNQLENAVTKKDLEKPMQMIEHIGTNVTRRSLTRQMRTFLKSEFKAMTPQGAVKAKTVDGATSRVLELAKTMYATMSKLPLGGEVAALQKQMRDLKADATEWANDQSADTKNLLADVLKVTERPASTRYNELAELRNKVAADGSASGEMLGYIDHMLDIMGDIDYFRGEQQKAKEASALNSKEDLEALKSELLDKSDKGILSEEDKAVLDNMPLYEMMVNLRQQQLDIDGGGAASIDAQIRNKQNAIKVYRAKMNELPKTDTAGRERYKALIEQVGGEIDDLFASRIVDQKAVNNGMRELIDDLVTLKEQGHSRLVEWSKNKQKRILDVKQLANNSFSASARGYWDEVNKKGHRLRDINNFLNNVKLIAISPALSFEYMLGTLDKKYYTNDSPIYNRFIKSQDGLLKANDNFFEGLEAYNKEVNDAANRLIGRGAITNIAEWFKKGDRFATEKIPFAFEVDQMFDDGTVRKVTKGITATMTRGQAAKIYAWSRMADGMAKLKAHGVTDETLAAVKDFIGEGYMRFVDWVEDDFFPRLRREKYNPKYKEIYGISMAENEHYFPFAIYKKDVRTDTDLEQIGDDKLGGGLVGNLIERKRNNARLDFTRKSPDIFDMITRYGETMEEWNAYAQVREDLKAMVNDKMFKVKCDMFGTDYYKHFLEAARVASRTSDDKALAGKWNTFMSKLQKVLASGAISMRVSTALKQLLSAPAFAVYSLDPKFLHQLEKTVVPIDVESAIKGLYKIGSGDLQEAKKLLLSENWVGHYNWCVNNLPSFRERVSLGGAGNPILEEKGFSKLCDAVQSVGMIPNRLVDAFTCSVGAKAVYEYNFNKYKKMYGEKAAHNMAVTEAEIAFNSSQQSSNPVFLSPMQVSKQFFLRGLMNFKNSPIGYLRAGLKANIDIVRAIKSIYNPIFKVDGQEMRFNSNGKNAASMLKTAAVRSAMYNFYLNFIWNFGVYGIAGLSYTAWRNLSGEGNEDGNLLYSDEEWKKATGDNLASTLFLCATQGLPYISGPFATAEQGTEFAPLMLFNTLNEMGTDIYQHGLVSPVTAQWITNLALKNGAGIDPQVCAQVYEGMQGILADRPVTEEDIMNLLASPRSAISGMTKQKVGEYDRLRDYVNARIKSNREIGIDERMDFGKALAGKRELRKSNLDYYIDEYLEANIPGYREISGRKSKETKQEEQANKKIYEQSMSLVEKIVGTPSEANEQKASKIDSKDEDIKYMVRRLRDAVAAIHKLYAAGDYSTAEDIAAEMQRRIERGYDPNGKTLDERLKNVDIWEPVGEVTQDSPDGYYTNFDRAIGGEFKKMYVGKMNGEGN